MHAIKNDLSMSQIFEIALQAFVNFRKDAREIGREFPYYVATRNVKLISARISPQLDADIKVVADEDQIPLRRVVYTAIQYYMDHHNLLGEIA